MPPPQTVSKRARIPVGVLGATGTVGQRLVSLLDGHPWFELTAVMASERSAGAPYGEVVSWHLPGEVPAAAATLPVRAAAPDGSLPLLLSALTTEAAASLERPCAQAGSLVVSNASPHRMDADVPLVIPEVNPGHLALLQAQHLGSGGLVTNPNCSSIGVTLALAPLAQAFGVQAAHVVTMQAVSGAGLPGVPSLVALDNVLPLIPGEEDKLETEPARLLGTLVGSGRSARVEPAELRISAQCNRVAVTDGHLACISVQLARRVSEDAVAQAWNDWRAPADVAALPSAPARPVVLLPGDDSPQPRLHRDLAGGMAVSVGRLRPCPLLQHRFVALVHNTVRGAAGGALLLAELLAARGQVPGGWTPPGR
ncbi:MAG: aspartate-semialdehyde dehydrogenase [Planctomycetota bacterium]|nr:MAG: aspartate-semialdehyde dehydrogenase [Planctomycetota bacterium]